MVVLEMVVASRVIANWKDLSMRETGRVGYSEWPVASCMVRVRVTVSDGGGSLLGVRRRMVVINLILLFFFFSKFICYPAGRGC